MIIAIAGHSGFIGRNFLESRKGDRIIKLERRMLYGDVEELKSKISGAGLIVNMAGTSIAGRWTHRRKRKILESRHRVNRNLVRAVNSLEEKPARFMTMSGIGIYSKEGVHSEESRQEGSGFMSHVVREWEQPLEELDESVERIVLRTAPVLGRGGFIFKMLKRTAGIGVVAIVGKGKQPFPFIHIDDMTGAVNYIIDRSLNGVFNISAPGVADQETFTRTLAKISGAGLVVRIPLFALRLGLGEAHEMVTEGQHVIPGRLQEEGYTFEYPDAEVALKNLLKAH